MLKEHASVHLKLFLQVAQLQHIKLSEHGLAFGATAEQRQAQLNASPKLPEKVARLVETFKRNPYVVAEVLHRAAGVCGSCLKAAPFTRKKDGVPYLEMHHRR